MVYEKLRKYERKFLWAAEFNTLQLHVYIELGGIINDPNDFTKNTDRGYDMIRGYNCGIKYFG